MTRLLNLLEHLTIIKIIASFKENVCCSFASHSVCIQFTAAIRIATLLYGSRLKCLSANSHFQFIFKLKYHYLRINFISQTFAHFNVNEIDRHDEYLMNA